MKRRYSNRHRVNKPDSDLIYLMKSIEEKNFRGDICYYNFKNADIKIVTPKGKVIIDNNYRLLEFYDYNAQIKLTAFYDDKCEIIEWYFDIAKEIGNENGVPYHEDLYLDIVVKPDGKVILLDEEELNQALENLEISEQEYKMAYREANNLISVLQEKKENLKNFTDKYLKYFEN